MSVAFLSCLDACAGTFSGMLGHVCPDTFTSSDLHGGK